MHLFHYDEFCPELLTKEVKLNRDITVIQEV
jgi:hypothetical protein